MSVRRLAEVEFQPEGFAFSQANAAWAQQTISKYPEGREHSAVIPLLMRAQEQEGWVTKAAIEHVADMIGMPYIRALEVATFYTQFQLAPVGTRAHIQVCGTTPCMLRGSEELMRVCKEKIHPDQFHRNESGTLSWEEVECLGACVNAPMVMIFKDTYEDLTPERLAEIIDLFDAGQGDSVTPGPQNGRFYSAPASGFTTLTDETVVLKETRDREARKAAPQASDAAAVAPTQAAKPKTDAPETDPRLKSPSPVKADPAREAAESVKAPIGDAAAADRQDPAVEGDAETRQHSGKKHGDSDADTAAPETLKGEPIGPAGKRRKSEAVAPEGDATPEAPVTPAPEASLSGSKPAGIERPATPDDLKLISGVGPKIEGLLHGLGVFTYAQIAGWTSAEREWVDGYLRFRGRIERDDWVRQADALARGGEAEYVRVFGKKPR